MAFSSIASLAFIDSAVSKQPILVSSHLPAARVLLQADQDGIDQITAALTHHTQIQTLHLLLPEHCGCLQLGATHLSLFNLDRYGWQVQQWGESLTPNAVVQLYGYGRVAQRSMLPQGLLSRLQHLIGARVVARSMVSESYQADQAVLDIASRGTLTTKH